MEDVDFAAVFASAPSPFLALSPDGVILDANRAYERVSGRRRDDLLGRLVVEAFPDDPDDTGADGSASLWASLQRVVRTAAPHTMPLQRYDVQDPVDGRFRRRYWCPVNVPVLDDDGTVTAVLHRVEEVTEFLEQRRLDPSATGIEWEERARQAELELHLRAKDLRADLDAAATATRRLSALAEAANELAAVTTATGLLGVVRSRGLLAVDADRAALAVADRHGRLGMVEPSFPDSHPHGDGLDGPLPLRTVALGGHAVVYRDAADCLAANPRMRAVVDDTGCEAWIVLPLRAGARTMGALAIGWRAPQPLPDEEFAQVEAFAAQCAQALYRIHALELERAAAAAERRLAETLQRSLLTDPAPPADLDVAVAYVAAADDVRVGGDWYDLFTVRGIGTYLVIGDVAGHDGTSAAAMAQLRSILRGIALTRPVHPAELLTVLDGALYDLAIGVLATATVALVEPATGPAGRTLYWSNAGHPPPAHFGPDGRSGLLHTAPELLLGTGLAVDRTDHRIELADGDTVLLYTDGLVERRGADLDQGFAWLADRAAELAPAGAARVVEALRGDLPATLDDDVALIAVTV